MMNPWDFYSTINHYVNNEPIYSFTFCIDWKKYYINLSTILKRIN